MEHQYASCHCEEPVGDVAISGRTRFLDPRHSQVVALGYVTLPRTRSRPSCHCEEP